MKYALIKISLALFLTSCAVLNRAFNLKDQNLVEQLAEDAIEISSGQQVNLSEKKFPSPQEPVMMAPLPKLITP